MEGCENDEVDDGGENDLIEENEIKVHYEEGYDIEVNHKEGDKSTQTDSPTSEEFDEKYKRHSNVIAEKVCMKFVKATKEMITLVAMILTKLKK